MSVITLFKVVPLNRVLCVCPNQVMIKSPLCLFSPQSCTSQCEWWWRSSWRTCHHVGGKRIIPLYECAFKATEHSLNLFTRRVFLQSNCACCGLSSVDCLFVEGIAHLLPSNLPCCVNQAEDTELV